MRGISPRSSRAVPGGGLLGATLGRRAADAPPWGGSPGAFRRRFQALLRGLWRPSLSSSKARTLDAGSLRSGSAARFMRFSEDGERARLWGRWRSAKTVHIYVQQVWLQRSTSRGSPPMCARE